MPILVRPAGSNINDLTAVPLGWDRNTKEIGNASDAAKNAGQAVCGFLWTSLFDQNGNLDATKNLLQDSVLDEAKSGLNKSWAYFNDMVDTLKKIAQEERDVDTNKVDPTAADKAAQIQVIEKAFLVKSQKYDEFTAKLTQLPWPDPTKVVKTMPYLDQPRVAFGSGFTFQRGLVMTAGHVLGTMTASASTDPVMKPIEDMSVAFNIQKTGNNVTYTSRHQIKRIVLLGIAPSAGTPVREITDNDVAIVEVEADAQGRWPAQSLQLNDQILQANSQDANPVCLIGHPNGVPLKYTSQADGQTSRPKALVFPAPGAKRIATVCTSADIDAFNGNSGGPLIEATTHLRAIGVARRIKLDEEATATDIATPLWVGLKQWLVALKAYVNAGQTPSATSDNAAFRTTVFEHLRFYPDANANGLPGRFDWNRTVLGDPRVENMVAFERVDLYAPFTRPLSNFMPPTDKQRAVTIELRIFSHGTNQPANLQPSVKIDSTEIRCGNKGRASYVSADDEAGWVWKKTVQKQSHLNPALRSNQTGSAELPIDLFTQNTGFCAWKEVRVTLPVAIQARVTDMACDIKVTFGYDQKNTSDSVSFFLETPFAEDENSQGTWTAHIGKTIHRVGNKAFIKGAAWGPPQAATIDLMNPLAALFG